MNAVLLISIIIGVAVQNIVKKPYTEKTAGGGAYFFSAAMGLFAMLFFLFTSTGLEWNGGIVLYSAGFALSYMLCTVASVIATGCGSLSLTALIISYSLMIPAFYGLIFNKDSVSAGFIPGIILLAVSLFLINKKEPEKKFGLKWIISVLLAFAGNGMCSVVQNMQQKAFDGAYKNEFMIVALLIVTVFSLVMFLIKERNDTKLYFRAGILPAFICGVMNGMVNLFVMLLSGKMALSLMFPLISSGGIIITFFVSTLFYKEKFTKAQLIGFIAGVASVVFLNI
jgi:drug/metabolite transporter (DMT)-like permease